MKPNTIDITEKEFTEALEKRHGKELQSRFSNAVVAICGLGGLGSHVAFALARAGVGTLILIDYDQVDLTNLHRQQYKVHQIGQQKTEALSENIREFAPFVQLKAFSVKLCESNLKELLEKADVICEAFDQAEEKAMLVNGVLELFPEKDLVCASGMAGLASANLIRTRKISSHFYLCGDEISDVEDGIGLVSSRVMVCAAHEAHIVLRLLAGEKDV